MINDSQCSYNDTTFGTNSKCPAVRLVFSRTQFMALEYDLVKCYVHKDGSHLQNI